MGAPLLGELGLELWIVFATFVGCCLVAGEFVGQGLPSYRALARSRVMPTGTLAVEQCLEQLPCPLLQVYAKLYIVKFGVV